jgi:hypothetical protein
MKLEPGSLSALNWVRNSQRCQAGRGDEGERGYGVLLLPSGEPETPIKHLVEAAQARHVARIRIPQHFVSFGEERLGRGDLDDDEEEPLGGGEHEANPYIIRLHRYCTQKAPTRWV